ncbi:MAG: hypothetical protein KUG79_05765 [Pseudomonadales bacterium]|nr:hypothetical protein [Pseudomonadales bacterium]
MNFLAILILYFVYRHWYGDNPVQSLIPGRGFKRWLWAMNISPYVRYGLCVSLPAGLVLVILSLFSNALFGLVALSISVLVLVFALKTQSFVSATDEHVVWLQSLTDEADLMDAVQNQEDFLLDNMQAMFEGLVPVLFWFLVMGPVGALLYSISVKYLDLLEQTDTEEPLVEAIVFWAQFVPARITALLFALVGNFGPALSEWRQGLFASQESHAAYLIRIGDIAIAGIDKQYVDNIAVFASKGESDLSALEQLFDRAIYGWLGIAAVVTIVAG